MEVDARLRGGGTSTRFERLIQQLGAHPHFRSLAWQHSLSTENACLDMQALIDEFIPSHMDLIPELRTAWEGRAIEIEALQYAPIWETVVDLAATWEEIEVRL